MTDNSRGLKMTVAEFMDAVRTGCFIDYDGYGYYATEDRVSDEVVRPSDVYVADDETASLDHPSWATHVDWYNR